MFKKKRKKKNKGKPSAVFRLHKECEYIVPLFDSALNELWRGVYIGGVSSVSRDKLRALSQLTVDVKNIIIAYDKVICENLNISDKPTEKEGELTDD